jgi:hypothetical protein
MQTLTFIAQSFAAGFTFCVGLLVGWAVFALFLRKEHKLNHQHQADLNETLKSQVNAINREAAALENQATALKDISQHMDGIAWALKQPYKK